jgi:hypothetical protein
LFGEKAMTASVALQKTHFTKDHFMNMKICRAAIINGNMALPKEVLEILPQDTPLYMRTDPEKGTVIIYALSLIHI